jgi:hypothetical protein
MIERFQPWTAIFQLPEWSFLLYRVYTKERPDFIIQGV